MVVAAISPLSEVYLTAQHFIYDQFLSYGEHAPNSNEHHLSITFKNDLYKAYRNLQIECECQFVSESEFISLWNACLPTHLIRPWMNVPGKCDTCYYIDQKVRGGKCNRSTREALRQCHHIHRGGMFMLERTEYKKRVAKAKANRTTIFSCIMDGMDQSHSQCPWLGTQNSFKKPLKQHIQGILTHGFGVTLYRTFNNVMKGADLTIHTFLLALEEWRKRNNGDFPTEIFCQIDGGSENANKYVLANMEWLVAKRMVKRVFLTRLPKGHSHEVL